MDFASCNATVHGAERKWKLQREFLSAYQTEREKIQSVTTFCISNSTFKYRNFQHNLNFSLKIYGVFHRASFVRIPSEYRFFCSTSSYVFLPILANVCEVDLLFAFWAVHTFYSICCLSQDFAKENMRLSKCIFCFSFFICSKCFLPLAPCAMACCLCVRWTFILHKLLADVLLFIFIRRHVVIECAQRFS